jgi:hypothetical protein
MNNIRPITISNVYSNILEKYILERITNQIKMNEKQFGFLKNASTQHGIFIMKEILNFFKRRRSRIYACAIDASKAFDKVWRNGLFHKIIDKISDPEWRVIYNYYDISVCYRILNGQKSEAFKTSVGVKQGGPMSPFLYNVYTQDLIDKIENLNSGPRIKELQISAIMYADDIMLMSTTRKGLEKMLNETASYLKEWKIKMNLNKTNYLVVGEERIHECPIIINNECIQRVTKIKYLGIN